MTGRAPSSIERDDRAGSQPASDLPQPGGANGNRTGLAVVVGVGAVLLSLVGSWHVSLWTDEAATIEGSTRSVSELWQLVQNVDAVHGLYYLFMHFWIGAFGSDPFSLRLPSALAVGVACSGVFVLGRKIADENTALLGALMFAILPRLTWAGIEARPFALTATIAVWSTIALLSAVRRPSGSAAALWVAYGLLVCVGTSLNIYLALLVPAHAIAVLMSGEASRRRKVLWLVGSAAGLLAAAPVVIEARSQSAQLGGVRLGLFHMARSFVVNQWFLGAPPTPVGENGGADPTRSLFADSGWTWQIACVVLALLAWVLMIFGVVRSWQGAGRSRVVLWWLLPTVLVPAAISVVYSIAVTPIYHPRYLAFASPAVALLIAVGIGRLRRRVARITSILLVAVLCAPIYVSQRQLTAKNSSDWVTMAAFVGANRKSGQAVYYAPRTPPAGAVVHRNLRLISAAYPEPFAGLQDATLVSAGRSEGSLYGTSRTLASSMDSLQASSGVWMLRWADYPAEEVARDSALLTQAGFHVTTTWTGPLDVAVLYER